MRTLIRRSLLAASALAVVLAGHARTADATGPDVGGDWLLRISGRHGLASLHFMTPQFGVFDVHGAGYTTYFPAQAFAVEEETLQTLSFDSTGSIHGTIALQNVTRQSTIGTLVITSGRANATFTHCVLKGTISIGESAAKAVVLAGDHLVSPKTATTGRAFDGRLSGRGVKSTKYDVQLYDALTAPQGGPPTPGVGYPFIVLRAGGACRIDGTESSLSRMDGLLVVDPSGIVYGRVISTDFGAGVISGRIAAAAGVADGKPVLHAVFTADAGRVVRLSAVLGPLN